MIIIRTLRKDIANYNREDDIVSAGASSKRWTCAVLTLPVSLQEDTMEESGWKNVHGDVFRPPQYPMILSSLLGSGIQLFCMVLIVICKFFFHIRLVFLEASNSSNLFTCGRKI